MIEKLIEENYNQLADSLRILTYRESEEIISKIDFNDNSIFLEPTVFAYFNRAKTGKEFPKSLLAEIMQTHFIEKEPLQLEGSYNKNNIAYIPHLGYYKKGKEKPIKEELLYVQNTNIEVAKYEIPLLSNALVMVTSRTGERDFLVEDHYVEENLDTLNQAFEHIKNTIPERYKFISKCCKKIVLFTEPRPIFTSRVTINALGVLYINVFEKEKNLPYFIDTIVHLTGSVIMTIMLQDKQGIFKIDSREMLTPILGKKDTRNIYTLYHRLYCHYAAFHFLHHYLEKDFCKEEHKTEITQRMVLYLKKCEIDLEYFKIVTDHFNGIENTITEDAINLYNLIENTYQEIKNARSAEMKAFEDTEITNYRMTYDEFVGIKS